MAVPVLIDLVATAGLRVVAGDPARRAATGVELVPADAERPRTGDGTAPPVGAPARPDATGLVLVVVWAPSRRGGALPPLRPLIAPLLASGAAAVLVAPRGGRVLHPPAEAVEAARRSGVPLLWASGEEPVEALLARLRGLVAPAAPGGGAVAGGDGAGDRGGPSGASGRRRDALLEGPLDVHRLTERVAAHLAALVVVTDAADRDVARHDGTATDAEADAVGGDADGDPERGAERGGEQQAAAGAEGGSGAGGGPPPAAAPLVLRHGERRIGLWHVHRERPLDPDEMALLDATAPVLVLALRVFTTEERAEAPVQELLVAVLGEDLAARERAVRRSRRLVVFPARSAVFLVVAPFGADVPRRGLERLARSVEPAARAADPRALCLVHEGAVVMLLGADTDLDQLQRAVLRRVNVPLALGAGRAVADVRGFAGAYRQAQRAAVIARRLGSVNRVRRFDDLGVHRLLHQLPEHERRAFVHDVLGPVAGADAPAAEARRVLRAYRAANGNATAAARQLFLHHNTFRQRLVKLAADLGDLDDADVRMAVFVALDLHRLDSDSDRES